MPDQDQKINQNDIPTNKKSLDKSTLIVIAMVIIMFISGGLYGFSELLSYVESPPDIIKIDYPLPNNNQSISNQNTANTLCEDSDIKSFPDDKYIKSDVIVSDAGGQTVKHDKCVDANQLEEMQCIHKPNGEIMSQSIFYNCSYGCLDGACVRTDSQQNKNATININAANENNNKNNQIINLPPPDKRECIDSDRNLKPDDIYTAGSIKVISEGEEKYKADDQCAGTNQLMEKECGYDGQGRLNNIGGSTYNCPNGCLNGACIRPTSQTGPNDLKAGVVQIKSAFF